MSMSEMAIFRQLAKHSGQNSGIAMELIPAGATIEELEKKAADCERKARLETEPKATKLREEALLGGSGQGSERRTGPRRRCTREWVAALRSGKWHA
jgi:hypothetical protein